MADPKALFVIHSVSREGIAESLNDTLGRVEFAAGDDRLTDTFCREYAQGLSHIDDSDDERITAYHTTLLSDFGLTPDDE